MSPARRRNGSWLGFSQAARSQCCGRRAAAGPGGSEAQEQGDVLGPGQKVHLKAPVQHVSGEEGASLIRPCKFMAILAPLKEAFL